MIRRIRCSHLLSANQGQGVEFAARYVYDVDNLLYNKKPQA